MFDPAPLLSLLKEEINSNPTASNPPVSNPLYKKLQRGIQKAIDDKLIGVNEALPSERDLAANLGVSRITIRKAITGLAEEGVLLQKRGAGTFINNRMEQPLSNLTGFTEDMAARGMKTSSVWLDRTVGRASPLESQMLKLAPNAEISRLYRLRMAEDTPLCLEYACLPMIYAPTPQEISTSLYSYLEGEGHKPTHAIQKIRAELFSMEHAHLLGVEAGGACLYIERQSFLPDGTPVEFVRSHYRGDSYDFIVELNL